jgi:hypothetical protein
MIGHPDGVKPSGYASRNAKWSTHCAPLRTTPRVKQDLYATRRGVDPTQVGTLVKVVAMASQREIVDIVEPAVLPDGRQRDGEPIPRRGSGSTVPEGRQGRLRWSFFDVSTEKE